MSDWDDHETHVAVHEEFVRRAVFVPLSVRHGNRRKRLRWWWLGRREALAFRIAPWLRF